MLLKSHLSPGLGLALDLVFKVPVGKEILEGTGGAITPRGDTTAARINQEVEKTDGDEAGLG